MKNYLILLDGGLNRQIKSGMYKIIKADSIKEALYNLYKHTIGMPGTTFQAAYKSMSTDDLRIEFINLFLAYKIIDIVEYTPKFTD